MKVRVFQYPKNPGFELQDLKTDVRNHVEIDYSYFESEPKHRIFMSPEIYKLQESVASYATIRQIANSMRGIEGYKYRYSQRPRDRKWRPFFTGQVYRYLTSRGEQKFVDFSPHIDNSDFLKFFNGDRLLVRRVVSRRNRLQAMAASQEFVIGKDLYSLLLNDHSYDIRYILALLNSTLISYLYYMRSTVAQKDDFRQTTLDEVREIPIAPAEVRQQQCIVKLVDKIIGLKAKIADLNFTGDLRAYFHTQPTSQITLSALIRWNELKSGQQKRLLDTERRHGTIAKVEIIEDGDWLIFLISGKQTTLSNKRDLRDVELFSIRVEDRHLRTFIRMLLPSNHSVSAVMKYMLDAVLAQKLPIFIGDTKKNQLEIKKVVSAYEDASADFHELVDDMRDTEALLDALVFKLYGVSPTAAATIIKSLDRDAAVGFSPNNPELDLDEDYERRVRGFMTSSQST